MLKKHSFNLEHKLLLLIIILSFCLRIYGVNMQYPHPDSFAFVDGAVYYGLTDVQPSTKYGLYALYVAPGFTVVIFLIGIYSLFFIGGWTLGIFPNISSFENYFHQNVQLFYILGRIGMVSVGVASIVVVYFIAQKLFDKRTGLLSALFLGVSFMHSMHSQFLRMDIISIFFILLAVYWSFKIYEDKNLKAYILTGVFAGFAIASKYTSGLSIFPALVAHILSSIKDPDVYNVPRNRINVICVLLITAGTALILLWLRLDFPQFLHFMTEQFSQKSVLDQPSIKFLSTAYQLFVILGIACISTGVILKLFKPYNSLVINIVTDSKFLLGMLAVALAFMFGDPIFIFNLRSILSTFIHDPNFMGENTIFVGADRLGGLKTHLWYLTNPINWGAGTHIALMGGAGLILSVLRLRANIIIFLTFPFLYYVFIGMGNFKWDRYALYLLPFCAIWAAYFFKAIFDRLSNMKIPGLQIYYGVTLTVVALMIIIQPVYNIIRYDYLLTQPDTRRISEEWIKENIPFGSKIAQDHYTGNLSESDYFITKQFSISQGKSLDDYVNEGYQYLIVSNTMYDRFFAEPEKYPKNCEFYKKLFNEKKLIKEILPHPSLWPPHADRFLKYHIHTSPIIKIFQL